MKQHSYSIECTWQGGLQGSGTATGPRLTTRLAAPDDLGGSGAGASPEELVLAASASCYLLTFAAMVERKRLPVVASTVESQVTVESGATLRLCKIRHRHLVRVASDCSDVQADALRSTAEGAERHCMIGNALRGSAQIELQVEILRGAHTG